MGPSEADDVRARLLVITGGVQPREDQITFAVEDDGSVAVTKPDEARMRVTAARGHLVIVVPELL